jgi:hypothetical protein
LNIWSPNSKIECPVDEKSEWLVLQKKFTKKHFGVSEHSIKRPKISMYSEQKATREPFPDATSTTQHNQNYRTNENDYEYDAFDKISQLPMTLTLV